MSIPDEEDPFVLECELLEASYGTELEAIRSGSEPKLKMKVTPYVGGKQNRVFVSVIITALAPNDYPNIPAKFELSKPQGMDDFQVKELHSALSKHAQQAAQHAELHIGTAFEITAEFLTGINKPNPCPICYEEVDPDKEGKKAMLCLKPCYHVLHADCYEDYRRHIENCRKEKEDLLVGREGRAKAARLARIRWAVCPVCRTEFDVDTADHELKQASKIDQIR